MFRKLFANWQPNDKDNMTGLIEISGCNNLNRWGDVVFVHGLGGHPLKTWHPEEKPDNNSWLYWLGEDLKDVGIWTFGYEAAFSNLKGRTMPRFDQARNLLQWLNNKSIGKDRPLVFITHSLGGLLVKQALLTAVDYPQYKVLTTNIKGIVFLATPHNGSHLANAVGILSQILRTTVSVKELENNNPWLRDLEAKYRQNIGQRNNQLKIATEVYYETHDTLIYKVVDEGSADPGLLDVMPIAVAADHITIAKPHSRQDLVYEGVKNFIQENLRPLPQLPPADSTPLPSFIRKSSAWQMEEGNDP